MNTTRPRVTPRNPVAVPARQRLAGPHGASRKAWRQSQQRALQRELSALHATR